MYGLRNQLKSGLYAGARKGGHSFIWICKIVVPVSFLVTLLSWSGWLYRVDFLVNPLMAQINLPAQAALPIVAAMLTSFYAALAIMTVVPFSPEQMILIAIFITIAHMLIVEGIIQSKSGIRFAKISVIRLAVATLTVLVVAQFLGDTSQSVAVPVGLDAHTPFIEVLRVWAVDTANLVIKILVIIMIVMTALESLKALGWIEYLVKFFKPLMRILGLSDQAVTMWVAGAVFGLVYGGAVITEEAKNKVLSQGELEHLHISIGVNHSIVEDPALLLALGVNLFWSLIPRFVAAAIAVHAYRAIEYLHARSRLSTG